jgi:putative ABC transport system permease protein
VAVTGSALPGLGTGLLADLEYADRLTTEPSEATQQVWLADTPTGVAVVDRLKAAGLTVVADERIAQRHSALDARGPATALRFGFGVALVLVAMGLLSFAVAASAERRPRGLELAALRRQGLAVRVVRRVGVGGYPALGLLAVALGVLTGVLLDRLLPAQLPVFADGSPVPARPAPVLAGAVAAGTAAVAFVAVALAAGVALTVTVRRSLREASWSA